ERLYLNAIEVWEWATENGVPVSRALLEQAQRRPEQVPPLSALLSSGGIHHDVGGEDKASVLHEIVQRLPLPAEVDREFLVTSVGTMMCCGDVWGTGRRMRGSSRAWRGSRGGPVACTRRQDADRPRCDADSARRRGRGGGGAGCGHRERPDPVPRAVRRGVRRR